jgi:hypothetical protein
VIQGSYGEIRHAETGISLILEGLYGTSGGDSLLSTSAFAEGITTTHWACCGSGFSFLSFLFTSNRSASRSAAKLWLCS